MINGFTGYPIYLQVYDQFYKVFSLEEVLIVKANTKIHFRQSEGLIDALLSDLSEKQEQVDRITYGDFERIYLETQVFLQRKYALK